MQLCNLQYKLRSPSMLMYLLVIPCWVMQWLHHIRHRYWSASTVLNPHMQGVHTRHKTCIDIRPTVPFILQHTLTLLILWKTFRKPSLYITNSCVMYTCFLQNMFASSSGQLGKRLNAWVSSTVLYLTSIIYAAAALINFFGCLWYWVARREGLTNSWLTDVGKLLLLLLHIPFVVPAIATRRHLLI